MRTEAEIVAMRDKLERVRLSGEQFGAPNPAVLAALRWVCDPSISDREILDRELSG